MSKTVLLALPQTRLKWNLLIPNSISLIRCLKQCNIMVSGESLYTFGLTLTIRCCPDTLYSIWMHRQYWPFRGLTLFCLSLKTYHSSSGVLLLLGILLECCLQCSVTHSPIHPFPIPNLYMHSHTDPPTHCWNVAEGARKHTHSLIYTTHWPTQSSNRCVTHSLTHTSTHTPAHSLWLDTAIQANTK